MFEIPDMSQLPSTLKKRASSIQMKTQSEMTYNELNSTFVKRVSSLEDKLLYQMPDLNDEVIII